MHSESQGHGFDPGQGLRSIGCTAQPKQKTAPSCNEQVLSVHHFILFSKVQSKPQKKILSERIPIVDPIYSMDAEAELIGGM